MAETVTLYPACVMPCFLLSDSLNYNVVYLYPLKRKANITATDIVLVLILNILFFLKDDSMLLTALTASLGYLYF